MASGLQACITGWQNTGVEAIDRKDDDESLDMVLFLFGNIYVSHF